MTGSERTAGWRGAAVLAVLAAVAVVLAGCVSAAPAPHGGPRRVVASFYPLYEAASRVGGPGVTVANLTPAGVEPHDLELSPDQVDELLDADLVVYLGGGFQPAVEKIVQQRSGPSLDVLDGQQVAREGGATDPHVWLDPTRMEPVSQRIEAALAGLDGAHAPAFEANLAGYRSELARLDGDFASGLSGCARHEVVTTHAAFSYLAARYGLDQVAISGLSPDVEPDADRLAQLADRIRGDGTTTVFFESLVSPDVARTVAREAGVSTAVLNPLEGLTRDEAAAGDTYDSVMRQNLATLRAALGCG